MGLALAWIGLRGSSAIVPQQFRFLNLDASMNVRVLWWSLGLAIVSGILVGAIPHCTRCAPIRTTRSSRMDARVPGHAVNVSVRAWSWRRSRCPSCCSLAPVCSIRSFLNIQRVNPGFDARGVLTMRLTLPRDRYPGPSVNVFFERLVERLSRSPGVTSVSAASQFPPMAAFDTQFRLERGQAQGIHAADRDHHRCDGRVFRYVPRRPAQRPGRSPPPIVSTRHPSRS